MYESILASGSPTTEGAGFASYTDNPEAEGTMLPPEPYRLPKQNLFH